MRPSSHDGAPPTANDNVSGLPYVWAFAVAYKYACELLQWARDGLPSLRSLRRPTFLCIAASAAFVVECAGANAWSSIVVHGVELRNSFDALLIMALPQLIMASFSAFVFVLSTVFVDLWYEDEWASTRVRSDDAIAAFAVMFCAT